MPEPINPGLEARLAKLEATVAELERLVRESQAEPSAPPPRVTTPAQATTPPRPAAARPHGTTFAVPRKLRSGEYWMNRIGIGLVLFGIVFLFKYAVDQGWLTPAVRIAIGILLGVGLIVFGLRVPTERKRFGQVLTGGGLAALYITGFAAFQILDVFSYPVAFGFMLLVTIGAFWLSLKQKGAAIAVIAAIGGFATPFLLYTDTGSVAALAGYTCLILVGSAAVFFDRGWRSLLSTYVAGAWLVLLICLNQDFEGELDQWVLQFTVILAWLAAWVVPMARRQKRVSRASKPKAATGDAPTKRKRLSVAEMILHTLAISTPLIGSGMSMALWDIAPQTWGWVTLGLAAMYGVVASQLTKFRGLVPLSHTHVLVGVMLATIGFVQLLDGNSLLFVLATEAAVLHAVAHRLSEHRILRIAHVLSGIVGLWLVNRIFDANASGTAVFNLPAAIDLWVIGVALGAGLASTAYATKRIYLLAAHVALLGWLLREFSQLDNGQGIVTIAWGALAIGLLVVAFRKNLKGVRTVAVATLFAVVGKLFLVDLAAIETIWRVLLFLGFGGLFLLLGYQFPKLWRDDAEA